MVDNAPHNLHPPSHHTTPILHHITQPPSSITSHNPHPPSHHTTPILHHTTQPPSSITSHNPHPPSHHTTSSLHHTTQDPAPITPHNTQPPSHHTTPILHHTTQHPASFTPYNTQHELSNLAPTPYVRFDKGTYIKLSLVFSHFALLQPRHLVIKPFGRDDRVTISEGLKYCIMEENILVLGKR